MAACRGWARAQKGRREGQKQEHRQMDRKGRRAGVQTCKVQREVRVRRYRSALQAVWSYRVYGPAFSLRQSLR